MSRHFQKKMDSPEEEWAAHLASANERVQGSAGYNAPRSAATLENLRAWQRDERPTQTHERDNVFDGADVAQFIRDNPTLVCTFASTYVLPSTTYYGVSVFK